MNLGVFIPHSEYQFTSASFASPTPATTVTPSATKVTSPATARTTSTSINLTPVKPINRSEAEAYVWKWFPLTLTGARPGERIRGNRPASNEAEIEIRGNIVPPRPQTLDLVRGHPDLWIQFLEKLNQFKFFAPLTNDQKVDWLYSHAQEDSQGKDFSVLPQMEIKLLQPGTKKNKFFTLTADERNQILREGWVPGLNLRNKIKTKKGNPSLVFFRSYWTVLPDKFDEQLEFILDLNQGKWIPPNSVNQDSVYTISRLTGTFKPSGQTIAHTSVGTVPGTQTRWSAEKDFTIGIVASTEDRLDLKSEQWQRELVLQLYPQFPIELFDKFKLIMSVFTPGGMKSLLQKCIRFRADQVQLLGLGTYPTEYVLVLTILHLLASNTVFVPNIQQSVSGIEGLTKRLAITIVEDAYLPSPQNYGLVSLMGAALLAKRESNWVPARTLIESWIRIAIDALHTNKYYKYDVATGLNIPPIKFATTNSIYDLASVLFINIGGMHSDGGMLRDIAQQQGEFIDGAANKPSVMPIEHCMDQHWSPYMVYFYPPHYMDQSGREPFGKLFSQIWKEVGSRNSRKGPVNIEQSSFGAKTREIQQLALLVRGPRTPAKVNIVQHEDLEVSIDPSWIAAMVGSIVIDQKYIVTLDPKNITTFQVVRKPFREMKTEDVQLEYDQIEYARNKAEELLTRGIKLNQATAPIPSLMSSTLYLENTNLVIRGNDVQSIADAIIYRTKLDLFTRENLSLNDAMLHPGIENGKHVYAKQLIQQLLPQFKQLDILRAVYYLTSQRGIIEFPAIARNGGGTDEIPSVDDVGAFQILVYLSILYPAALELTNPSKQRFKIKLVPVVDSLAAELGAYAQAQLTFDSQSWGAIAEQRNRTPKPHQSEALSQMIARHQHGRKGHLIWVPTGQGKTFIILSYLHYLWQHQKLPPYVLYTLPPSAVSTVYDEIRAWNFQAVVLNPVTSTTLNKRKSAARGDIPYISGLNLIPGKINLIVHDDMARAGNELINWGTKIIFIMDEIHKAMGDSLRTQYAQTLAQLSLDFIGMSGTMLLNEKAVGLIRWLRQIVPYEVNSNNYWVAVNSMVNQQINTGITIHQQDIEAPFTPAEWSQYQNLVKPTIGGLNPQAGYNEFRAAAELAYTASYRRMAEITNQLVGHGHGVMLVVRKRSDQAVLQQQIQYPSYIMTSANPINLTPAEINAGKVPNYRVVIVSTEDAEGYSLIALDTMISSVYFTNQANRTQLEGRLDRLDQPRSELNFITVHAGLLTLTRQRHLDSSSLQLALKSLGQTI